MKSDSHALAIYAKIQSPIEAAQQMGKDIAESGFMEVRNAQAGAVIALTCMAEGITPLEFSRVYHIIKGKPTKKAGAVLVEFRQRGGKYDIIAYSPDEVRFKFYFEGKEIEFGFTWEEVQEYRWPWVNWRDHSEGYKDNWATPMDRKRMMFARMCTEAMNVLCPEITYGLTSPEEMADVTGSSLPADEDASEDAIDADYTVNGEHVTSEPTEAEPPFEEAKPKAANDIAIGRIAQLINQAGLTAEQRENMLQKRGVTEISELTPDEADKIIERLEKVVKAKK